MKFSQILLFSAFLLPFQIHAMDTPDEDVHETRQPPHLQASSLDQNLLPDQNRLRGQNLSQPDHPEKKRKRKKNPSGVTGLPQNSVNSQTDFTKQNSLKPGSVIRLPKDMIENTMSVVENRIQHVIHHKIEKPVTVHVLLDPENISAFHKAFEAVAGKYPFPFTWSLENKGKSKVESERPSWIFEISLRSRAKERERVEKEFVYKFSDEDKKKVDWQNIYDVAMRSRFTLEDFEFNNSIKIRTIELDDDSEVEDLKKFQHLLKHTLAKDENPFHILCITLNRKARGHHHDMLNVFLRKLSEVNVGHNRRGVVFDPEEGLLYLCLDNTHRRILDLHGKRLSSGHYEGRSTQQGEQDTQEFILQAYEMFKEEVTVLTGRGNHLNPNGTKGVLREAFRDWMAAEPFPSIVKKYCSLEGDGGYKVIFKKIQKLNLNNSDTPDQNPILVIKEAIAQMIRQKQRRLYIVLNEEEGPSESAREFKLLMSLYADLYENNKELVQLITPLSFESIPGELKIIFNNQHSKNSSSFSFAHLYGSASALGTIHYWNP